METHLFITYEVIDSVSNERFFTEDRQIALAHHDKHHVVYEKHLTVNKPSGFIKTENRVTILWSDNPDFEEKYYDHFT